MILYRTMLRSETMLITTGKVNNGVIRIDSKDLPDGTTVTLIVPEGDETFELDPAQETELLAAIAEAEHGQLISASEILEKIAPHDLTTTDSHRK
jgi:hypothetical protein